MAITIHIRHISHYSLSDSDVLHHQSFKCDEAIITMKMHSILVFMKSLFVIVRQSKIKTKTIKEKKLNQVKKVMKVKNDLVRSILKQTKQYWE
ncbi:MAG: hypothetical protein EZS28_049957 [Streblomastix strix]|uniref:Uncharacterized protein n=1 Tax=Streblomastix strix TaxID=222440 RepID=A0A5J4T7U7_9EUKA|nr:MAG: hypothetical protein EZS28_049957 [Streblomastix strix]